MCPEEDRKPARKTCMKCEISMCVQHLQAHLTTPVLLQTHPLTEPMALDGNIKCPHHGKLLEYYCLDDMNCVCVSCSIEDQHRLHNMKTFPTAHKELTEKLGAEQQVLKEKTDDDNKSPEKWEKREREKLGRCSVRLIEAVTNLRDISLTSVQSSVSGRMVSIRTSSSSMQAAQKETDTFKFLQMYSQVHQDVEKAKAVDLRRGLEPGKDRDKLVQEIRRNGEKMVKQASQFVESLLALVDPENHQEPLTTGSDLIFEPQSFTPSMSLSKDKRKIFYHSWLGQCSATVLISSTQSAPNFQRWVVSLTKDTDWMVGLCDKQSTNNLKKGPVYGLFCKDNRLGYLTTEYDDFPAVPSNSEEEDGIIICNQMSVSSASLTHQGEDGNESVPRPEKVEVLWNFIGSTLSFFSRTGQYQREEIITIKMSHNNRSLAPFVQLGVENIQSRPPQNWQCSCGQVYIRDTTGYRRKQLSGYNFRCSCGTTVGSPCVTDAVCELLQ
ncbi:tripartite motif-containing protein 16 isoform X2 [Melanotaenia boesemani]|uniref:tripartite motif-containing protein 16 isoform X2 n=1 Tax=Melanotaenia boesemani TaxID=1250792 RepID=UPI001C05B327|nr:tripartite motif-containing protein 16 isoform X2 [Melanotaenia boesemani]